MAGRTATSAKPQPAAALPVGPGFASVGPSETVAPSETAPATRGEAPQGGADRLASARRLGHDFARIPVHAQPSLPSGAPIQRSGESFKADQRNAILEKNRKKNKGFYQCEHCGFKHAKKTFATRRGKRLGDGSFHVDHIEPKSKGGQAKRRNARVLCGTCNTSRGNRDDPGLTGRVKYRGLHGKRQAKDYSKRPPRSLGPAPHHHRRKYKVRR